MKIELDDVESIHETTLTIRGSRRRTTVPLEIVEFMKLKNGDKIRWVALKNGTVFVTKAK
ncbi:MAG TPA: AbrB family transcriptional regulator [Candidatus Altiarchaeales archaeon]|nr:AbrB family transcriptional regulator [Candidatus Altiarchaeales archaeon]